jgi:hypothetical protein
MKAVLAAVLLLGAAALFTWYAAGGGRIERGLPSVTQADRVIKLEEAPAAVQETARRATAAGGVIEDVTEVHHHDGSISYDVDIIRDGRKVETEIASDGAVIERKRKK